MKTNVCVPGHCLRPLLFLIFTGLYAASPAQKKTGDVYLPPGTTIFQNRSSDHLFKERDIASTTVYAAGGNAKTYTTTTTAAPESKREDSAMEAPAVIRLNGFHGIPSGLMAGHFSVHFRPSSFIYPYHPNREVGLTIFESGRLRLYALLLKEYAVNNHFDTCYALLANMGMLSTRKRFFVVNLHTLEVEQSGLVSHGRGPGMSIYDRSYSNDPDSKCTSLGRYKILSKYKGTFGLSYQVAGLDSSNSNAMKRRIVLHSMHCIPDMESYMPACVSEGCPAVSEQFFKSIRKLIDTRKKPMLLWIIDSNLELPEITEIRETVKTETTKIIHRETAQKISFKKHLKYPVKRVVQKTCKERVVEGYSPNQAKQINELLGFRQ